MSSPVRLSGYLVVSAWFIGLAGGIAHGAFLISDNLTGNNAFSATERTILRQAETVWQNKIGSLMATGRDNFTITYSKSDTLGAGTLALARDFEADNDGKPLRANVFVNQNLQGSNDSFLDQTPADNSEFMAVSGFPFYLTARANVLDPGTGFSVSTLYDFFSTAMHEIGHAVGITAQYSKFSDKLGAPMANSLRQFLFANGDFAVLTLASNGTHTASDQFALFKGKEYDQNHDMMNPIAHLGERIFPSDLDLAMLVEAYGYKLKPVPEPTSGAPLACGLAWIVFRRGQRAAVPISPTSA